MFKSSITIKGGAFNEPTLLENILAKRMNIVYGRNGSGKSTIARAFREQQTDYQQKHPGRSFQLAFDEKNNSLPEEVRARLFVFNEDFIDDNVKFSASGGLRSIIRIGASAELNGPIEETKQKISDLKKNIKPLENELAVLEGKGEQSISAAEKLFKDGLKCKGGFLERLDKLEGRAHNLTGSLSTAVLSVPISENESFPIVKEAEDLERAITRYLSYQGGTPISWQAPDPLGILDLGTINSLLERAVRPAELSEQEKTILDDLSGSLAAENFIVKTQTLIVENDRGYCPLCHQPISAAHKHMLEQRIIRFRDKQVEDFKAKVRQVLKGINTISDTIPDVPSDNNDIIDKARTSISNLNNFILNVRQALESKQANPFSAMPTFDISTWTDLVSASREALANVTDEVNAYNQKLKEKKNLLAAINQKNLTLAAYENRAQIMELKRRNADKESLDSQMRVIQKKIDEHSLRLQSLQGQLDQIDDAREQINYYLDIIFGDRKLRLANATKDSYKLQVKNGNTFIDIPTKSISSGERNALALAYFFACVMEKKEKDYDYSEPTLLIIDDPVSSFDAENKAGVISLLSVQCKRILDGNAHSKILVFTHDQTTLRTLCEHSAKFFDGRKDQTESYFQLTQSHKLRNRKCSNIHGNMEYYSDLTAIFNFASYNDPEECEDFETIGNTMRSFAEHFASHMYKCGWLDLFSDNKRLECLPRDIREKIKAFAIRSVLNSESHSVFSDFEPAEIQRAAKMLLVFMYYSSYDHLYAYLVRRNNEAEDRKKMEMIANWGREF